MAKFKDASRKQAEREVAAVNKKIREGYPVYVAPGTKTNSAVRAAAEELKLSRHTLRDRIGSPKTAGAWKLRFGLEPDWDWKDPKKKKEEELFAPYKIEHEAPPIGMPKGKVWRLESSKDNKFRFAALGDFHAASKYCRPDVRADLTTRAEAFGAQCIFDTGNWIEGEASFNRYDIEVSGVDEQIHRLAEVYPKTKLPTLAVTGADHEGWYAKREGLDVGRYCENVMRDIGHDWTNLGYMQADVLLVNANTHKSNILRVMHPGAGSSYAISYRPQKIIECVPLDSEILTRSGWMQHDEVEIGDEVLGYNVESNRCEWTEVTAIHKGTGSLVRYSNDQFDVRCTANHRWPIEWENRSGSSRRYRYPPKYSRHLWTINDAKDRARIIQAAPAPDGPGMSIQSHADWLRRDLAVETVMTMTSGERKAFIEGMLLGEGTIAGNPVYRSVIFSQRPGPVCDAFRLACFLEGITTTERPSVAGSFKPDGIGCSIVTVLKKHKRICNRLRKEELGTQEVWCVTTGLGTWVMRQGKLITITGNSFEGGQKPAVLLMGHYHKLDAGLVRNVWYAQTGTCQDQTPFMAQKALEAHVGGVLIELEQDPKTGAIISYTPQLRRYFDRGYYYAEGKANNRWSPHGRVRPVPRKIGQA